MKPRGLKQRILSSQEGGLKLSGHPKETHPLQESLDENLKVLTEIFEKCGDISIVKVELSLGKPIPAAVIYVDSLTDSTKISQNVLHPLFFETNELEDGDSAAQKNAIDLVRKRLVNVDKTTVTMDYLELTEFILKGQLALLIEGYAQALLLPVQGGEHRAVSEPDTEPVVLGPKDGFIEALTTNMSLIRRRIRSSRLKVEKLQVGVLTRTEMAIFYIQGVANPKIVDEVRERLHRINVDGVLTSNRVAELIIDEPFSLFPLVQKTERPDRTAAALLEGRVALIVDNAPTALLLPCTMPSLLQASEDYTLGAVFSTIIRLLRFVALNIALILPAFTISVFAFNQELLPSNLLHTVARDRQNLPFPILIEILLMEFIFEVLREAGVRLPKAIGQTISTVGGLVIGQAAVSAGIVGPAPVIVVSLTAIASFTIPDYEAGTALRILRFFLIFASAIFGLVGMMFGLMALLIHLTSLRSFGIPYLSPLAPLSLSDLKDTFIRVPGWAMLTRPRMWGDREPARQDFDQGPRKPDSRS